MGSSQSSSLRTFLIFPAFSKNRYAVFREISTPRLLNHPTALGPVSASLLSNAAFEGNALETIAAMLDEAD